MIYRQNKLDVLIPIFLLIVAPAIFAQADSNSARFGIGVEVGNWSPSDLSNDVALTPLKKAGKHPYLGIILMKPWRWGMTFRSSLGYWRYCNDKASPDEKGIEIGSILLDLKYAILSDVILMPYVSYGVGWFFGAETKSKGSLFTNSSNLEMGIGINVGTGFDFQVIKKLNLAMEFRYHYVKFSRVVAFTDNYSGAKVSLGVIYQF